MLSPQAMIIEQMFMIPDKDGKDVEFKLNVTQRKLDTLLTGRDIVPKARQEGVSAFVLAYFLAECLSKRNVRAVVISHDLESTKRLLARVHYYIDHMRGPKPVVKESSKGTISFPLMDSVFYIGTAGSREFGRGDTITHLHCSEYAFWPDPVRIMTGLLEAVPASGKIIIESTGNGLNDYYKRCMRAIKGFSSWTVHFMSWVGFPDYQIPLDEDEKEYLLSHLHTDWEEDILCKDGVSLEQIAWRRIKISDKDDDLEKFKQEYPRTLNECFQMSSKSIFRTVNYEYSKDWVQVDRGAWVLKGNPNTNGSYIIGADPAAGVGEDYSVIEVVDIETMKQVGEWVSNTVDPEMFGYEIRRVATVFNMAYVTVESNNHGILTLATLEKIYPYELIYRDDSMVSSNEEKALFHLGYKTSSRNKPLMIGRLRTLLTHEMTIYSDLLKGELSTFVEDPDTKKLGAQDGCHDDTVMAMACCVTGVNPAAMIKSNQDHELHIDNTIKDPFTLDGIIDELRSNRSRGFPISPQHRVH